MKWRHYGTASEADLVIAATGYRARLIRLKAGRGVPRHTHGGSELTVVLEGSFSDETGHYARGDLAIADRIGRSSAGRRRGPWIVSVSP